MFTFFFSECKAIINLSHLVLSPGGIRGSLIMTVGIKSNSFCLGIGVGVRWEGQKLNPGKAGPVKRSKRMEELAESHGCVKKVKELERKWQNKAIFRRFRNVFTNVACGYGGYDKGAQWWK